MAARFFRAVLVCTAPLLLATGNWLLPAMATPSAARPDMPASAASALPFAPPDEPVITHGSDGEVTIEGRLFFNDRRETGLFGVRLGPDGNPALECDPEGKRDPVDGKPPASCSLNWAAAQYVVVDAIERDTIDYGSGKPLPNPPKELVHCRYEELLDSATVDISGRYQLKFTPEDRCGLDDYKKFAIQLRFRLRFCNENYCFSLRSAEGEVYRLSHRYASGEAPLLLRRGDRVRMPDGYFKTVSDGAQPEFVSVAANYYASLVDTILTVHRDNGIPFFGEKFGEVEFVYPADSLPKNEGTSSATTRSPSRVVISSFEDDDEDRSLPVWPNGKTPGHEYGHVLMLRAWDGEYGFDGIGKHEDNRIEGRAEDPAPQIAFKEAWAELVKNVVFETSDGVGCTRASLDENSEAPLLGTQETGIEFLINNQKALCDWFDSRNDGLDLFEQHSLKHMWKVLRGMFVDRERYVRADPRKGLNICDFVAHYQTIGPRNGSKTDPNSGVRPPLTLEGRVLENNRIECLNVRN